MITTALRGVFRLVFGRTPEPPDCSEASALVLLADGIGGLDLCGVSLQVMAGREGAGHRVEVIPWCHGFGRWHRDLTNTANLNAWAARLADQIQLFRADHPATPVYLVGKSGGTGVVVQALERLPVGTVQGAVLLAPALSPGYDLGPALLAVRDQVTVFWSPLDIVLLGAGTLIFGTIDRVHSVAAGLTGFKGPTIEAATQGGRLCQVRWRCRMAATGYLGGHLGCDSPYFLKKYVIPLLAVQEPNEMAPNGSAGQGDPGLSR